MSLGWTQNAPGKGLWWVAIIPAERRMTTLPAVMAVRIDGMGCILKGRSLRVLGNVSGEYSTLFVGALWMLRERPANPWEPTRCP